MRSRSNDAVLAVLAPLGGNDGFGLGGRFSIPIVRNGFIGSINNSVAIGLGLEFNATTTVLLPLLRPALRRLRQRGRVLVSRRHAVEFLPLDTLERIRGAGVRDPTYSWGNGCNTI